MKTWPLQCLTTLQSFPTLAFLHQLSRFDHLCIEADESFQKRSFRNRINLLTAQGIKSFSIPLEKGKNSGTPILNVKIAFDEPWQKELWRSIQTHYGSAPYFEHYASELYNAIFYKTHSLYEYNWNSTQFLVSMMKLDTIWSTHISFFDLPDDMVDTRNCFNPRSQLYARRYAQVFEQYTGPNMNLSGIDLLLNMGPESRLFLHKFSLYSVI